MRTSTTATLSAPETKSSFGWIDLLLLSAVFGLLWSTLHFGRGMLVHFDPAKMPVISTDIRNIPYYAGRTVLRMWIAFAFSMIFTLSVAYAAAKNRAARTIIIPFLDIMQSVPVLGFLSVTVTGFMALFPGSLLGVECASIFAIFTGQVWNMAFGFYHSLVSIPQDLQDAATAYRMNKWQRFTTVEVPASMHSLIWNSMMSMAGGWFFVTASEAITVNNLNINLPGMGSYIAAALSAKDYGAVGWAVVALLVIVVATDQLIWRPLLAWADNFKIELTDSSAPPESWLYDLLRRAYFPRWISKNCGEPVADFLQNITWRLLPRTAQTTRRGRGSFLSAIVRMGAVVAGIWICYEMVVGIIAAVQAVWHHVSLAEYAHILRLGLLTFGRVLAITVLATIIWTPIGVAIGFHPKMARFAQPVCQMAASFPTNVLFPMVVGVFVAWHISINWGSILLMAMGTQWYILFNVVAGAMAIPNDLKEAARTSGMRGWMLWKTLILPAIFPFWVTGACTAAGGAWNASIVAEVVTWGDTTLKADGLGAFISDVTASGNAAMIICSIFTMSLFVVTINKLLWRRLYKLAEQRFHLD